MQTLHHTSTTEMEVTSIRLERELKEKLKELSGNQGYQALIRDVLWQYIGSQTASAQKTTISRHEIRASVSAIAQKEEACALTGKSIRPSEAMLLGLTNKGSWIPLSVDSLAA
jgi:metal-responsive CopG/Arc/MetJ family transcriptional regulator